MEVLSKIQQSKAERRKEAIKNEMKEILNRVKLVSFYCKFWTILVDLLPYRDLKFLCKSYKDLISKGCTRFF